MGSETPGNYWAIIYDDYDRKPEIFGGEGAERAAHARYGQISGAWNAHLFRKVHSNSCDFREREAKEQSSALPADISGLVICLRATTQHIRACDVYKNLAGDADYIDRAASALEQLAARVAELEKEPG